jgi:hypothetical protein
VTYRYRITTTLKEDTSKIDPGLRTKGRFIIATNELDERLLTSQELLQNYKGQQSVERGFRFLKEPAFMTPCCIFEKPKANHRSCDGNVSMSVGLHDCTALSSTALRTSSSFRAKSTGKANEYSNNTLDFSTL